MNIADRIRILGCGALIGALTGCVAYVEPVGPPRVYVPPPPVFVPPPPVVVTPPTPVEVSVGVEIHAEADFYEPLSPYGRWEVVGTYGRCWIPNRIEADWRPYCNGHWARTEAGWYWASDEPWGWATYHYGRWDLHPQLGWYWVPQTQWAPAWVSWHNGGGYVAWAPLHPSVRIDVGAPVEVDVRAIPQRAFVCVEEKRFLEPVRPTTVVTHTTTIINNTVNITNIKVVNNTVINEGPRTEVIEKASGRRLQAVTVHELRHNEESTVISDKRRIPPARNEANQIPVRGRIEPQPSQVQTQSEQRAKEIHEKAHEESVKAAKELERKAQLESEQHARELQRKAQEESQAKARELQLKAQREAEAHTKELHQKALEESQRHAKELERQAQAEADQHARDLQKRALEQSQQKAKELQAKAQMDSDVRTKQLHEKAHDDSQKAAVELEKKARVDAQRRTKEQPPSKKGQQKKAEDQKQPDK